MLKAHAFQQADNQVVWNNTFIQQIDGRNRFGGIPRFQLDIPWRCLVVVIGKVCAGGIFRPFLDILSLKKWFVHYKNIRSNPGERKATTDSTLRRVMFHLSTTA